MDFTLKENIKPDTLAESDEARPFKHIKIHVTPYTKDGL